MGLGRAQGRRDARSSGHTVWVRQAVAQATVGSARADSWNQFFMGAPVFSVRPARAKGTLRTIDSLLQKENAYCRSGDLIRDLLYVEDAGDAIGALARSNVEGTVNIASGTASQLGEVAIEIGLVMHLPELVHVASEDSKSTAPKSLVADVSRLSREVGWKPRFDRHDAIQRTIAWRAAQGGLGAA
jgi:nucleoside-diphosphate-sugar epimerase